jgi:hypothetical protein
VRLVIWIIYCLVVLLSCNSQVRAQNVQLYYKPPIIVVESSEELPITFWERFESEFGKSSESIFTDRFHSFKTIGWYLDSEADSAAFGERTARAASRSLSRSVGVGFRRAVIEEPFVDWLKDRPGVITDLILYAVDTDDEDAVAPLDPSYHERERSWWKQISERPGFRYGFRPFQESPYAFVSSGIWRGDSLLALAHVRYHYRRFADHQFQFAVSVPLSRTVAMDVGTAYQFGKNDDERKFVIKVSKQLRNGGIVHVGMEAKDRPTFVCGVSMPL